MVVPIQTMEMKSLSPAWNNLIVKTAVGGKVGVKLNEKNEAYFDTH